MTDVAATTYILIRADNSQVISELKKLEATAMATGRRVEGNLGKSLQKAGSKMSRTGSTMSRTLTLPIVAAGAASVKLAGDFESAMKTMEAVAGVQGKQLQNLSDLAMKMGRDTVFSATESANAMLELAKSGLEPAQIEAGALEQTLALATAGNLDLANAAMITANAMNTFGLSGRDSRVAVDALAGAANASSADVDDLAMALSMGGNAANTMGLSVEEATAALAAMADQGIRGSDAGTALKTMLLSLAGNSGPAREKIKELGLEFFDANENAKSLTEIADELQSKLGNLSQKQRIVALRQIFGTDAFRAANIVMEEGAAGLQKYIDQTSKAGNAARVGKKRMEGWKGTVEALKGSVETAAITVGQALIPALTEVAKDVTDLANRFSKLSPETQQTILKFAGLAAVAGPLIRVLGGLTSGVGGVIRLVKWMVPLGTKTTTATSSVAKLGLSFRSIAGPVALATSAVFAFGEAIGANDAAMRGISDEMKARIWKETGIDVALAAKHFKEFRDEAKLIPRVLNVNRRATIRALVSTQNYEEATRLLTKWEGAAEKAQLRRAEKVRGLSHDQERLMQVTEDYQRSLEAQHRAEKRASEAMEDIDDKTVAYIKTLNSIPRSKKTIITTPGAESGRAILLEMKTLLDNMPRHVAIAVQFRSVNEPSYPGQAAGGPVSPGRIYEVGERGPELFVSDTRGTIIPNHRVRGHDGAAMGGITINIDARGAGHDVGRVARDAVVQGLAEAGVSNARRSRVRFSRAGAP